MRPYRFIIPYLLVLTYLPYRFAARAGAARAANRDAMVKIIPDFT